eukprot:CAMPEP_0194279158 /NCGR_PEP_ID=MMETSP0169-20130528/13498_1 /TAXON_ID=218684 /ORGANISM="Corethron pennatum, Strain L29A3" /LENGTH=133 /DNA_ID=CAMNT_0039023531 /DNA_START=23 /DNA_END=424 /DNA_ORIENTATION=-
MKLSSIVLYAVTSPFLVGGGVTIRIGGDADTDCEEWCEVKGVKGGCVTDCENRRTQCLDLCGSFYDEAHSICKSNCECIAKAAKVFALNYREPNKHENSEERQNRHENWEEIIRMLSHEDSGDVCDDSEDTRL